MSISLKTKFGEWNTRRRISKLASQVKKREQRSGTTHPIIFFNVSSRIRGLSLNAAFSLLTGWSFRLAGTPVINYACNSGMSHCVLGTNRQDYRTPPPCQDCITQSKRLFEGSQVQWFKYQVNESLAAELSHLSIENLSSFQYEIPILPAEQTQEGSISTIPLGSLVLPSIRWALRQHNLPDDEDTRYLMRAYMLSAYNLVLTFNSFLEKEQPAAVVLFNGIMYPEAAARWAASQRGVRVISHEVGFQPNSAFFTDGEATAYPIHIPGDLVLNAEQNSQLDSYLENRFQGDFTMAGIRFWPEMHALDETTLSKMGEFQQIVPIFTNVVYDTSQVHANRIFPHMFVWLDMLLELIRAHPETLFFIRAHPDEMRPGTAKQSRESVFDWINRNHLQEQDNLVFIDSGDYISSYELIQRAKFVIVYNSSIGLEASLMGAAVLCGGKARYTQYPTVFLPETQNEFRNMAEHFLGAGKIQVPPEFQRNARHFIYFQLYRASLPFDAYLQAGQRMGFVQMKSFNWDCLTPDNSKTMRILYEGIARHASKPKTKGGEGQFFYPEAF